MPVVMAAAWCAKVMNRAVVLRCEWLNGAFTGHLVLYGTGPVSRECRRRVKRSNNPF
jgi:hypothetical protein